MYFSANELHQYGMRLNPSARSYLHQNLIRIVYPDVRSSDGYGFNHNLFTQFPYSVKLTKSALKKAKECIASRDHNNMFYKWYRPWEVVPALQNWSAPEGDYGVGIEVELGFVTPAAARQVANHVKNWKYITLDFEGGANPIEATFPPTKYSSFGNRSQAVRYLNYLSRHEDLVTRHSNGRMVGTHVNVSKGGVSTYNNRRIDAINYVLQYSLSSELQVRYFGRRPYGYINNQGRYLEMKLFNSVTNPETLKRYVNIAVSLLRLITSDDAINAESVIVALDAGYNGRIPLR